MVPGTTFYFSCIRKRSLHFRTGWYTGTLVWFTRIVFGSCVTLLTVRILRVVLQSEMGVVQQHAQTFLFQRGVTQLLFALVSRPLTTYPFRDGSFFLLPHRGISNKFGANYFFLAHVARKPLYLLILPPFPFRPPWPSSTRYLLGLRSFYRYHPVHQNSPREGGADVI